ncbi:hypothetical protein GCM10010166_48130 [Couchioplanes caeruleus subsp. azureus]|nr:hypothetical protein GCM10010166_48130 [Couchioplanes caeruleus subsp. azureus]
MVNVNRKGSLKLAAGAVAAFLVASLAVATPAAAAPGAEKVTQVSSLADYVRARAAGTAAQRVALVYGSVHSRGPNGQETHVLDVKNWGTADRSVVHLWEYRTSGNVDNQRWDLLDAGTWGGYPLVALSDRNSTNKCLDESRDHQAGNGTAVYIYGCHFEANQLWRLQPHPLGGGYVRIANHYDGRCLDVRQYNYSNGATIQVWDCHGGWNQAWA